MGYNPLSITDEQFTTPAVINELRFSTTPQTRLKIALNADKIKIRGPSPEALKIVEASSIKTGDFLALSKADREVLALSLELQQRGSSSVLVSDDYAVQNVAEYLGLVYTSLMTFGIRYRFHWLLYCPACQRKYPATTSLKVCEICGTQLRRRVIGKTPKSEKNAKT
jgi:UPF0271 protein